MELTVTLQQKIENGQNLYRWWRSDGGWVSPVFTDIKEAMAFRVCDAFPMKEQSIVGLHARTEDGE